MYNLFKNDTKGCGTDLTKLIIFARVYSFSESGKPYYEHLSDFAELSGVNEHTIGKKMNEMVKDGLLVKVDHKDFGFCHHGIYMISETVRQRIQVQCTECSSQCTECSSVNAQKVHCQCTECSSNIANDYNTNLLTNFILNSESYDSHNSSEESESFKKSTNEKQMGLVKNQGDYLKTEKDLSLLPPLTPPLSDEQPKVPAKRKSPAKKSEDTPNPNAKGYKAVMDYINSRNFSDRMREELVQWYNGIGKGRVSISQLEAKIKDISNQANNNEDIIVTAIHNAYLSGWFGFYLPREKNNKKSPSGFKIGTKSEEFIPFE